MGPFDYDNDEYPDLIDDCPTEAGNSTFDFLGCIDSDGDGSILLIYGRMIRVAVGSDGDDGMTHRMHFQMILLNGLTQMEMV